MGYDDNTPLTGVTGGGLPAEIWREAMVRIHKGIPASPLPMIERSAEIEIETRPTQNTPRRRNNDADSIIRDLIRGLLGG